MNRPRRAYIVIALDDRRLAIALDAVERVLARVAVTPLMGGPAQCEGVLNVGGATVPVVDLRVHLRLPPQPPRLQDRLLLTSVLGRPLGLHVDAVLGVIQVPAVPTDPAPEQTMTAAAVAEGVLAPADGLLLPLDLDALAPTADWAPLVDGARPHQAGAL